MTPHIDYTIRLTDLGMLIGFIMTSVIVIANIRGTLRFFGYRLDIIDATIEDLKREHGTNKVQDSDINRLKDDQALMRREMFELARGRGWVQREVDGLYMKTGKVETP